jgi:hypothetical protein
MKKITINKHQRRALDRFIREDGEMNIHPITISSLVRKGLLEYRGDRLDTTKVCELLFSRNKKLNGFIE